MNSSRQISLIGVLCVLLMMLTIVPMASAVTYVVWDNGAGDGNWNTPSNWSTDSVPPNNSSYYARINITNGPVITAGDVIGVYRIYLDGAANGTMTMNDGMITLGSHFYVAPTSVDRGTFNMSGGDVNIPAGTLYVARNAGSIATINLSGGTIHCNALSMRFSGGVGNINISGNGQILINTDVTLAIAPYITNGWIKAYGGKGKVEYSYNPNTDQTIIYATISNKATSASPINGATDVPFQGQILAWKPGASAISHNFYFGTAANDVENAQLSAGDIDLSGIVDFYDISRLVSYWLADPAGSVPYAGVNGDSIVDLNDFAVLAQNWKTPANSAFQGNLDSNTFDPGLMAPQTTYYWRVDEVNGPNTLKGNLWSFTTQSGKAYLPSPPDAAPQLNNNITLSWLPGLGAQSHSVYFGTTSSPSFRQTQSQTTFNPGTLAYSTTYYWRVDETGPSGTLQGDLWTFTTAAAPEANYSLVNKVMCGYQGWFNTPTDGANRGWVHWGPSNFTPLTCSVDMWPDMTEMTAGEKYLANGFSDGNDFYVFSSYHHDTVKRHFLWMAQYGIDGVFLQRFGTEVTPGTTEFNHRNTVLSYCKEAANFYTRKYAVMYDLTSLPAGTVVSKIENDWKYLIDTGKINVSDPALMRHNNKPVVAVWGIGWSDTTHPYSWSECLTLINFLKDDPTYGGFTVMVGVRNNWRSSNIGNPTMLAIVTKADIISPWDIASFNWGGIGNYVTSKWLPDKAWCNNNGKDYMPVIWPGYSFYNASGHSKPLNQYPRYGGQFLWDQVRAVINNVGTNMIYVAMFDEVDEGTAIFKVSNNPPRPNGANMFVTYNMDGYNLPSDDYLYLVGQAAAALRGDLSPVPDTRPSR